MKLGEIVYCNLHLSTIKDKRKPKKPIEKVIIKEVVFAYPYSGAIKVLKEGHTLLQRNRIKVDMNIDRVEIIKRLGFKNKGQ